MCTVIVGFVPKNMLEYACSPLSGHIGIVRLLITIAKLLPGSSTITFQGTEINLTSPWPRMPLLQAIHRYIGIHVDTFPQKEDLAVEMFARGYEADPRLGRGRLIDDLKGAMLCRGIIELRQVFPDRLFAGCITTGQAV